MKANWILASLAVASFASAPFAAITTVNVGGGGGVVYTVHTGTTGGQCVVTVLGGDNGVDVQCSDASGNSARANSRTGCGGITGKGLCARGQWTIEINASTQLDCDHGVAYNVSTGTDGGQCNKSHDGGKVDCTDGGNNGSGGGSAHADCDNGCGNTSGAGCCCRVGTSGCDPGKGC